MRLYECLGDPSRHQRSVAISLAHYANNLSVQQAKITYAVVGARPSTIRGAQLALLNVHQPTTNSAFNVGAIRDAPDAQDVRVLAFWRPAITSLIDKTCAILSVESR